MRFSLTVLILCLSTQAFAYELLVVQAVSSSKKTFVTRNGKRQGVVESLTGTFTAENVALIARAMTVTSQFTQWQLVNDNAKVPFEPGSMVTYHPAQEYIWALNPEAARKKFLKELRPVVRRSWIVKGAMTKGLNETVSSAAPQNTSRGGIALDALYERLYNNFAWDAGIRYENEVVNLSGGSLITQRMMAVTDLLYYFEGLDDFYSARVFIGIGMGYGQSSTDADGIRQSGFALLLPAAKIGIALPFDKEWDFMIESAFETLKSTEELEDKSKQTTNQSNLRIAVGLRKFF
jgi:hypothetical protein